MALINRGRVCSESNFVNKNFNLFISNEVKGAWKIVADSATIRLGCT